MIVNPLSAAYSWFLNFYNVLPDPIKNLCALCVGLFAITVIVHIVMR